MATTSMDYEAENGDRYEDEAPRYERDNRSASPRPMRDEPDSGRRRSASPGGHGDSGPRDTGSRDDDDGAVNPGSNLFVTGIHPRLSEAEVSKMFEKYGDVEKCQIMRDPHTKESRGFGFVKMVTSDQAEAAKEGLQGEQIENRTLSIEKARRAKPRTPTPGKYFGPPKREGGGRPRFDDRRRGGYGGGMGRDDPYRYRGYERRYDDRSGGQDRRYDDRSGGYDRGYRDERRYDDRGGYGGRDYGRGGGGGGGGGDYDRSYDRGYERRDRDDGYGRERYGGRDDRDRYGGRGGGGGSGGRSRDAPAGGAYAEGGSRSDARDGYGASDAAMP